MTTLAPIATRRLYRHIADLLEQHIDGGQFPPGSLLPPERELAQQLGVSRASVREALIALEVQGRVAVRVGSGVSVLATKPSARGRAVPKESAEHADWPEVGPLDVIEARLIVECQTAAMAARNATDADIAELERQLKALRIEHRANSKRNSADRAFHLRIAAMSRNQALVLIVTNLWDQRDSTLFARFEERFSTRLLHEDASHDHRNILDAIAAHDARAARAAMKVHLDRVHRTYSRAL